MYMDASRSHYAPSRRAAAQLRCITSQLAPVQRIVHRQPTRRPASCPPTAFWLRDPVSKRV
ncbi:hypothetical protein HYPSUDRAFT_200651 [Hypholoma sublateritium FD-334 SS-4]|uniref:Uncharacterized protein n=1 Tax=Hypholoma sublateritium (strain FD-334 SS-4) TaxID=945553 RepID=A0A0D2PYF8_HYPSF|nr:hypothetical protein HYPSUDRAFT_200651 [Hypholoma sublateritium FD-334 SS-4]